jgi:hypothetical protein
MVVTTSRGAALSALLLTALSGCSLVHGDLEKAQCKTAADCASASSATSYSCVQGICQIDETMVIPDGGTPAVPCSQDMQCGDKQLCGFDGFCYEKWGCLQSDRDWPTPGAAFRYRQPVRRFESIADLSLVGDLTAVACAVTDPNCSRPVVRAEDITLSPDKVLDVPFAGVMGAGFVGFIKVVPKTISQTDAGTGADAGGGAGPGPSVALPTYLHITADNPLVADFTSQHNLLTVAPEALELLKMFAAIDFDVSVSGMVVFKVYDCGGRAAAGVSVTPVGVPNFTFVPIQAESTPVIGGIKTGSDGAGALIGPPPDRNQIFLLRDEDQQIVINDAVTFIVRGAANNFYYYYPRYRAVQKWLAQLQRQSQ